MFRFSPTQLRCTRAREWVSRVLDDDLDEARRLQLASHLVDCPDCRQHQAVLERGQAALRTTLAEPSENFEWKVQLGIQRALRDAARGSERATGSFWRPALASAAGVAALVVGLGSFWLLDGDAPRSTDQRAFGGGSPALVAGAPASTSTPVTPDLSGAIPGRVFEFDASRDGFGIRTVSRTTSDPRFSGDLYAPVRDAGRVDLESDHGRWISPDGSIGIQWMRGNPHGALQLRGHGVQVLNLQLRGSTLPSARLESDSPAESTLSAASQR